MKGQLRIDSVFAFIVLDEDGTEGIPAARGLGGFLVPLIGADMARIDDLRAYVERDPMLAGKRVTLAHFTNRTDLEVIQR